MAEDAIEIPYKDIPGFPVSTAPGHKGSLLIGTLSGKPVFFDIEEGGLRCRDCVTSETPALPLSPGQAAWLRDLMKNGIEKTTCPPADAPFIPLLRYLEARLDCRIRSAKGLT